MGRAKTAAPDPSLVTAYVRVSTAEQADSGLGLEAQRVAIAEDCARRGWTVVAIHEDAGISGKSIADRPGLNAAMEDLKAGRAGTLMASKLDRISRSLKDYAGLMDLAQSHGWNVSTVDLSVDLSTPSGEFVATVMAGAAQLERRLIGQRTKDAMAVRKSQGAHIGRSSVLAEATVERILASRNEGQGWSAIARTLNEEGVPTGQGGAQWWPATVQAVALARDAQ
jgi:DNA invertase Pin-like site-specific DNA recombinase